MIRYNINPRQDYKEKIEKIGFNFHTDYWRENAFYSFTQAEIEQIERASNVCYEMYCKAVQYIIDNNLFDMLCIPLPVRDKIIESWENDDLSLYGRFDFTIKDGIPKLLEFNADTPTSLLEASIIQWDWKKEMFPNADQFNSIHENLVQSWKDIHDKYGFDEYHFAACRENVEDEETLQYIVSTAMEAGLNTVEIDMEHFSLSDDGKYLVNPSDEIIEACFKLYPWEWMFNESIDGCKRKVQWFEPMWKSIMSNKAILAILYKLFPNSPYILPCYINTPGNLSSYCKKPIYSREGANIELINNSTSIERTSGDYGTEGYVYQEFCPLPKFYSENKQEKYPVIGSWIIGGVSCGMGIRETNTLITNNMSEFIPHIIM